MVWLPPSPSSVSSCIQRACTNKSLKSRHAVKAAIHSVSYARVCAWTCGCVCTLACGLGFFLARELNQWPRQLQPYLKVAAIPLICFCVSLLFPLISFSHYLDGLPIFPLSLFLSLSVDVWPSLSHSISTRPDGASRMSRPKRHCLPPGLILRAFPWRNLSSMYVWERQGGAEKGCAGGFVCCF